MPIYYREQIYRLRFVSKPNTCVSPRSSGFRGHISGSMDAICGNRNQMLKQTFSQWLRRLNVALSCLKFTVVLKCTKIDVIN